MMERTRANDSRQSTQKSNGQASVTVSIPHRKLRGLVRTALESLPSALASVSARVDGVVPPDTASSTPPDGASGAAVAPVRPVAPVGPVAPVAPVAQDAPVSVSTEDVQYCDYGLRISRGKETVVVRQYSSGKLVLQGKRDELFRDVLATMAQAYNSGGGQPRLRLEDYLAGFPARAEESLVPTVDADLDAASAEREQRPDDGTVSAGRDPEHPPGRASCAYGMDRDPAAHSADSDRHTVPYPYIGIDESGKGDYFGPLVIAAVRVDERTHEELLRHGVRDSKELSDQRCRELAALIRETCADAYAIVEISPARYNSLYKEFKAEKQSLNNLLAWGHARALENLLEKGPCEYAISDQFGNEGYICSKLMAKGASVRLLQEPRAEKYIAVAAASILARDRFLSKLKALGEELGIELPKGASAAVVETAKKVVAAKGPAALANVAKLHFKTTEKVLGGRKEGIM